MSDLGRDDPSEWLEYAGDYQARRKERCEKHGAMFLPLEVLRSNATGALHLSVSFGGGGEVDTYVTKSADYVRAVKVALKWFFLPTTRSRLLARDDFSSEFDDLLETQRVDGEEFWVFRAGRAQDVRDRIRSKPLDNSFRTDFQHAYLPDSEAELGAFERRASE